MVSDIVLEEELPDELKNSVAAYASCIAGASLKSAYLQTIRESGFRDIMIAGETVSYIQPGDYQAERECETENDCCCHNAGDAVPVTSLKVSAVKPAV